MLILLRLLLATAQDKGNCKRCRLCPAHGHRRSGANQAIVSFLAFTGTR
jgi:hypothetical protein